jgi:PDZ domain-containing protein
VHRLPPIGEDGPVPDGPAGDVASPDRAATAAHGAAAGPPPAPGVDVPPLRRSQLLAGSAAVTALLLLVMMTPPAPYAIESPGLTVDVLGEVDGRDLITVTGAPTYPTDGVLSLTTVYTRGGPRNPVDLVRVVGAWLSPAATVVPVEVVYPRDLSAEDYADSLAAQMVSSQENAAVAALTELGYEVPAALRIAGTVPDTGADGVLAEGDVVLSADGSDLPTFQALVDVLAATPPGTSLPLEVLRDGRRVALEVVTRDDDEGGSVLGAFFDPEFELPIDVEVRIDEVGGPSAGLVFALGIVDLLTPGALTGGERIAVTGTIAADGDVGPISGVGLKAAAAARDGADYFLVPLENCADARDAAEGRLRVVGVETLGVARAAMVAIAERRLEDLPGCPA